MLLRRITQHVKAQSRIAVGIDFVIVASGIFVGLQVTEWNEQRQLREREVDYLERLALDQLDEFVAVLDRRIASSRQ